MTPQTVPTREEIESAAKVDNRALKWIERTPYKVKGLGLERYEPWLDKSQAFDLLCAVEKWLADNHRMLVEFVNAPGDSNQFRPLTEIISKDGALKRAKASGNSDLVMQATFNLASAIGRSME